MDSFHFLVSSHVLVVSCAQSPFVHCVSPSSPFAVPLNPCNLVVFLRVVSSASRSFNMLQGGASSERESINEHRRKLAEVLDSVMESVAFSQSKQEHQAQRLQAIRDFAQDTRERALRRLQEVSTRLSSLYSNRLQHEEEQQNQLAEDMIRWMQGGEEKGAPSAEPSRASPAAAGSAAQRFLSSLLLFGPLCSSL